MLPPFRIEKSTPNPRPHNIPCTHSRQVPLSAIPNQPLTSVQRPLLFGVRRELMRVTIGRACVRPLIRKQRQVAERENVLPL